MPGDPLKKVLPGQRLEIPAGAFNAFMDAARFVRSHQHDELQDPGAEFRQTTIVKIRNQAGQSLPRYSVLALREPIIGPADKLREFKNKVNFEGYKPEAPSKCEKFAVLFEPLAEVAIGRGIVAGVTPIQVYVVRESDTGAELVEDETAYLRSSPFGQTRILWKEPGLGLKWAVVRLGDRPRFTVFELTGNWVPAAYPEPDGWAKMEGCKPALYFRDEHTYRPDATDPSETVWHQVGYPADERDAVIDLHKATGLLPSKFGRGDWVWCIWNEHECRWQILALHEDHWRFVLLTGLTRCGSALAQLVLYREGRWCPVPLTFTVHDSIGVVCPDLCKASGSGSSGQCGCGTTDVIPAGTYGIAKHFADSAKWEVLALGQGCCEPSSSYSSSGSSSGASSSSSGSSSYSSSAAESSSGLSSESSSSSDQPSSGGGSSSGSGPTSSISFEETDIRCEADKLNVYRRTITVVLTNGLLGKSEGPWTFSHQAGCCCCCCSSSSASSGSSSSSQSSLAPGSSSSSATSGGSSASSTSSAPSSSSVSSSESLSSSSSSGAASSSGSSSSSPSSSSGSSSAASSSSASSGSQSGSSSGSSASSSGSGSSSSSQATSSSSVSSSASSSSSGTSSSNVGPESSGSGTDDSSSSNDSSGTSSASSSDSSSGESSNPNGSSSSSTGPSSSASSSGSESSSGAEQGSSESGAEGSSSSSSSAEGSSSNSSSSSSSSGGPSSSASSSGSSGSSSSASLEP